MSWFDYVHSGQAAKDRQAAELKTEVIAPYKKEIKQLQNELAELKQDGITLETQNRIREFVVEETGAEDIMIDGSGCDSGDPVDLTLAEIGQGLSYLGDVIAQKNERIDELEKMYNELILAVAHKHENETRHQTALRYIQEREGATGTGKALRDKETL